MQRIKGRKKKELSIGGNVIYSSEKFQIFSISQCVEYSFKNWIGSIGSIGSIENWTLTRSNHIKDLIIHLKRSIPIEPADFRFDR